MATASCRIRSLAADSRKAAGQIRETLESIRQQTVHVSGTAGTGSTTVEEAREGAREGVKSFHFPLA